GHNRRELARGASGSRYPLNIHPSVRFGQPRGHNKTGLAWHNDPAPRRGIILIHEPCPAPLQYRLSQSRGTALVPCAPDRHQLKSQSLYAQPPAMLLMYWALSSVTDTRYDH